MPKYQCPLIYIFIERICCRKSKTPLFIPDLLPEGNAICGEGWIPALGFMTGRIKIAKKFSGEAFGKLVAYIEVKAIIKTIGIVTGIKSVNGMPVKNKNITSYT